MIDKVSQPDSYRSKLHSEQNTRIVALVNELNVRMLTATIELKSPVIGDSVFALLISLLDY